MKQLKIFSFLFLGLLFFSSCKKWLEVSPATQVTEDEQYTNLQGFMDGLFGIYQKAAGTFTYGRHMSYGLLDVLAQRYENKTSQTTSFYGQIARYNYTNITNFNGLGTIESIWNDMYATIAQANFIIRNADRGRHILSADQYNIIRGEALGMRAYLHFDLLRSFAPSYLGGTNANMAAIPYMTEFTVSPQTRLTMDNVLMNCEKDLKEAETLLSVHTSIDQIAGNQGSTSADLFLMYRQNHMNYWAVKATLARLYLYKGDNMNALKYANEVISSNHFRFVTGAEVNLDETNINSDMTFTREHIFSIYVSNMKQLSDVTFKNNSPDPLALGNAVDLADLYSTRAKLDAMYEQSVAGHGTDIRGTSGATGSTGTTGVKTLWYQFSANIVYTKKYWADNETNVKQRLVPLIKLAEMYYIAAEASATPEEGVVFLNAVRTARLIPELATSITAANLDAELLKEYRKEFYGEGQLWFYFKRKNTTIIPDGVGNPMTAAKYLFPYPQTEIEFGK